MVPGCTCRSAKPSKLRQRRQRAGGDDIGGQSGASASIRWACTVDGDTARARRLAQEGGLALVALDQMDLRCAHDRQHQAGQAGAAAEIDQPARVGRPVAPELAAVQDVPAPRIGQRRRADQIDRACQRPQQVEIGLAADRVFHVKHRAVACLRRASAASARSCGAAHMPVEQRQGGGRHARDPGRRAQAWPAGFAPGPGRNSPVSPPMARNRDPRAVAYLPHAGTPAMSAAWRSR